jgi:hypothetical protein
MLIERRSPVSGVLRSLELNITPDQYFLWETGGVCIQNAMPNLTNDEREFIMTGITAEEWEEINWEGE